VSIFEHRKPIKTQTQRDLLGTLRTTLARLEALAEETPRVAELKLILSARIAELEGKNA
jgi:hypothetical protein